MKKNLEDINVRKSLDSMEVVPYTNSSYAAVPNKVMGPVEWLLLIALSIVWGGSFFFGKVAVTELPPFTVVLSRVALAAIALNVMVYFLGHRMPVSIKQWKSFFVMGMLNNLIPFSLILWGQTQIASGLASILNATTPLFTAVLAHFLTGDERLTGNRLIGVFSGVTGVAIMIGMDSLSGLGLHVVADLAVIAAAVSYSCAGIFGRRFKGCSPLVVATGQVTATTVMALPVALITDSPWNLPRPGLETLFAVIALGLLCTALAYIIYFRILATAGATNVLLVTFLIPVSALLLGTTLLDERLQLHHISGMALITLGLAAIDGRLPSFIRSWPYRRFDQ
ncbi:MAG: DMT family transporter [Bacillota bacterium]